MNVEVSGSSRKDISENEISEYASSILRSEAVEEGSSLSIVFLETAAMAEMNQVHMGVEGPTDVLSLPIEDALPGNPPLRDPSGPPLDLGDVFICCEVVENHADEYDVSFESELRLMVTHGVLHILGWDHQSEVEAEAMETRESKYLEMIGVERR